jgi:hypothetical protein
LRLTSGACGVIRRSQSAATVLEFGAALLNDAV